MALCSAGLHEMLDSNLLLEFEKSGKVHKRCRACKNDYEAKRKRFKRANPGQPFDRNWQEPKFKLCKKSKHEMTPKNTILVGRRGDKRCRKCYNHYRKFYMRRERRYLRMLESMV